MSRIVASLPVLLISLASGCSTFFGPGNAHKETGSVADLLMEPTLDIGWDTDQHPPEAPLCVKWSDYYDVDGHGYYDVVVVATEEVFLLPCGAVAYAGAMILSQESFMRFLRRGGILVEAPATVVFWIWLGYEGVTEVVGCAAVAVYDSIVHDIPVLVVGKPARAVYYLFNPSGKPQRPPDSGKPRKPKKSAKDLIYPTE